MAALRVQSAGFVICALAGACGLADICLEQSAKKAMPFWLKAGRKKAARTTVSSSSTKAVSKKPASKGTVAFSSGCGNQARSEEQLQKTAAKKMLEKKDYLLEELSDFARKHRSL